MFMNSVTFGLSCMFGVTKKRHEPELNAYTNFTLHASQNQVRLRPIIEVTKIDSDTYHADRRTDTVFLARIQYVHFDHRNRKS
jgi:hypothetical protein